MNPTVNIRKLRFSDLPRVVGILKAAFPDMYDFKNLTDSEIERILYLRFKFEKWISRIQRCAIEHSMKFLFTSKFDRQAFVAEEKSENEIVGVAIVSHIIRDVWNLDQIAVHSSYQNRGIGTQLMKNVMSHVENRTGKIQLSVSVNNANAVEFYRNLGFASSNQLYYMIIDLSAKSKMIYDTES